MKRLCLFLIVCLSFIAAVPLSRLDAQNDNIVLSLAIPEYIGSGFSGSAFSQFESDHPGVKIHLAKTSDTAYMGSAAYSPDDFFKGVEKYAGAADVLYVNSDNIGIESTRAGYFLDLSPLTRGDSTLNSEDVVPAAWQAFQWDGGIWALPATLDVIVLCFDSAAFDKAGLTYPSGKWSIDDLADAARKLTVRDASGKVTAPGLSGYSLGALFRSASGESFLDESVSPSVPHFDTPGLLHVVEVWAKLQEEGVIATNYSGPNDTIPLRIDQSYALASNIGPQGTSRVGSLFPGDRAGLSVDGFAVSSGTQHPELAYALAKYLTSTPQTLMNISSLQPARKSLVNTKPSNDMPVFHFQFSPENQAVLQEAIDHALPPSDYPLWQYLDQVLRNVAEQRLDAETALQQAESMALATLKTAADKRKTATVAVITPVPTPVLKADEIAIKFYLAVNVSPLPNREQWEKVIEEFTANDPQVRQIAWETNFNGDPTKMAESFDCFAMSANYPITLTVQDKLLNLDPLINADTSFDKNDFVGDSLARLRRDNKIFALPLYLEPEVLRYNVENFNKAGIKLPDDGWDVSAFGDALKALKPGPGDPAPFEPRGYSSTYLLMLIAAYGGVPLDSRTTPTTINFTDPTTVDAIQQVLDLAKKGYIKYAKFTGNQSSGWSSDNTMSIYTDSQNMTSYYSMGGENNPYRLANYPRGANILPVAYSIGAAYITARTANPEACYRWISTIARHPELFWAMPARRSLIDDPGTQSQGPDVANFYRAFDKTLQDPSVLVMPAQIASVDDYILAYFLNRAFDRYVLDNADLQAELKQAELFAKGYQECTANIAPMTGATTEELVTYYKQFSDCAIKIDPGLKSVFGQGQ